MTIMEGLLVIGLSAATVVVLNVIVIVIPAWFARRRKWQEHEERMRELDAEHKARMRKLDAEHEAHMRKIMDGETE